MKEQHPAGAGTPKGRPADLALFLGGPLFQLLRRANLSNDALSLLRQRILAFSCVTWLPLLALCLMEGNLLGGITNVPFLKDVEVHARLLVVIPLLIVAELVVQRRIQPLPRQFLERKLVPDEARPRFDAAVASAVRLRSSVLAEVLLLVFVYGFGILILWKGYVALATSTWYATPDAAGPKPTWAGLWYGSVSLPIFQFLLCRWYFRMFVWARFLWQVSRLGLLLVPTHPDRMGGLSFLSETGIAFSVVAMAHGAMAAGPLAGRIFFLGASIAQFKTEIAILVLLVLGVVLGPLLVFSPSLFEAKWRGLTEYGTLAGTYVREFDDKWLRRAPPANEAFVGSADIQSLADLGNSYEVVRGMRVAPITYAAVLGVASATLLPLVPLLLTAMPFEELMRLLTSILF